MFHFCTQSLKKGFAYFLAFSILITSFPSFSYAGYGIAIDSESTNLPSRAIRVLFLDIDTQKVEEVNYYTPHDFKGTYILPPNTQHLNNPLRQFVFNDVGLEKIILDAGFTTDIYTVISSFPLFVEGSSDPLPGDPSAPGRYYYKTRPVRSLKEMIKAEPFEGFKPTFRRIHVTSKEVVTHDFLEKALGGEQGEAKTYKKHKEKLGEHATLLSLLEYGYSFIYDPKIGQRGMDFVVSSGENPSTDTLLLVESKWTSDKASPSTHLDKELTLQKIIERFQKLSKKTDDRYTKVISIIKPFFAAPNSKIYRFLYKIYDDPDQVKRGHAKPALSQLNERDRVEIARKVGGILPPLDPAVDRLYSHLATLNISAFTPDESSLLSFMFYLKENGKNLTSTMEHLKSAHSTEYVSFMGKGPSLHIITDEDGGGPAGAGVYPTEHTNFVGKGPSLHIITDEDGGGPAGAGVYPTEHTNFVGKGPSLHIITDEDGGDSTGAAAPQDEDGSSDAGSASSKEESEEDDSTGARAVRAGEKSEGPFL